MLGILEFILLITPDLINMNRSLTTAYYILS